MRIAILCHATTGGSGILATELALSLCQLGHDVHIVGERPPFRISQRTSEQEPIYRDLGESPPVKSFWGQLVELVRRSFAGRFDKIKTDHETGKVHFHELFSFEYPLFDGSSLPTLRAANTLATLIDKYKIEIVNAHYAIPHATSAILARDSGLGIKVVTTLHGTDVTRVGCDPAFNYTTRHAIRSSDEVTAVCDFLAVEAKKNFSLTTPIQVIPNWVDSKRFIRQTDPRLRAKFAQPDEYICVHVSNFRPVKRSTEVVRIFAKLLGRNAGRLILVGEGPEKQACIDLAVALGVSGRVLSIGPLADVESIIGISDLLLLPSEIEAFPLVILEAMAAGSIAIASKVGGISEMITHSETGFLFDPSDIDGMAEVATQVIQDPALSEKIRENARAHAVEKFSPERLIERYVGVYENALGGNRISGNTP